MMNRIEQYRLNDLDKFNTFFLSYYKSTKNAYNRHMVRPCVCTYEQTKTNKMIMLDGSVLSFSLDMSIPEILLECAVRGITIDYVEIIVSEDSFNDNDKIVQVIDCHKEDITKKFDEIDSARYYLAKNNSNLKNEVFKFLVVDRFSQPADVKFLLGEYDMKGVIAGFKNYSSAVELCEKMNKEIHLDI